MHVLFVHQNFPAQFGHIAAHLVNRMGWRCTFVSELEPATVAGIERIQYKPIGGATVHNSFHTRTFENCIAHTHGVYEAMKARPDVRPDLIVGHSGFGSTLFLRELYGDTPIINYFEYFYRSRHSDLDFLPDSPPTEEKRLRARARNAMLLLDLNNCDAGYAPTGFQRSVFPAEYRPRIRKIFDGVDTRVYHPMPSPPRVIAGRTIPPETRIVTYCARGFERMRGFDIFMKAAKIIYQRFGEVVFVAVGSDRICYGDSDAERRGFKSFREYVLSTDDYDLSKFIFTGNIPPTQLAQVLAMGDVHVYLTIPFVLSWSMMNALACGAVVVGSDTPPVREMIRPDYNGFLADFFSPEAFADRVVQILRDPPSYANVRRNAAAFIQQRYSLDAVLPQLLDLYETTARGAGERSLSPTAARS
jgi:glycosyltransferase involved in cell wall biosynthesis